MKCSCKMMHAKKKKKPSMYKGGGKMKKASMYKDGGKVKSLLKGLEGMPDRKGRKLPKDLPVIGRDRFDMSEFVEGNPFFSRSAQAKAAKAMKAKRAAKGISSKK